jgi:hypothetical protein
MVRAVAYDLAVLSVLSPLMSIVLLSAVACESAISNSKLVINVFFIMVLLIKLPAKVVQTEQNTKKKHKKATYKVTFFVILRKSIYLR